jgi:hypothetical protein
MFRLLKRKRIRVVLLLGIVLSLTLSLASSAIAGPPVGKIYDCYSYNQLSGFDTYVQAVELKTRSVYLVAPMRNGNHLSGAAAKGRYLVHGRHVTFPTGAYAIHHLKGIFKAAGKGYKPHAENELDNRFDLYENGINFMTCYEH